MHFNEVFARKETRIYLTEKTTNMKTESLESIARQLVAPGKGILAADESSGTIEKRLKSISVPSTEENRRMYRQILFTTKGAGDFISGVILFDETIRQKNQDGRSFVEVLEQQGIVPGIKVDTGAKAMAVQGSKLNITETSVHKINGKPLYNWKQDGGVWKKVKLS